VRKSMMMMNATYLTRVLAIKTRERVDISAYF